MTDLPEFAEDTVVALIGLPLDVRFVAIAGNVPERDLLAFAERPIRRRRRRAAGIPAVAR